MQFSTAKMLVVKLVVSVGLFKVVAAGGFSSVVNNPVPTTAAGPLTARPPASNIVPAELPLPSDYCSTAVYHINVHRLNYSAPMVTWSPPASILASTNIVDCDQFPPADVPGSNLWGQWGSDPDPFNEVTATIAAINAWYSEEPLYADASDDFTVEPDLRNFINWGHFSQMTWDSNSEVGCWSVPCPAGTIYGRGFDWSWAVVCAFTPGGNIAPASNYVANIQGPLGNAPDDPTIWNNNQCS